MARLALAKEHNKFFEERHFLEVEGVIPYSKVAAALESIEKRLASRLDLVSSYLGLASPEALWLEGRDLWRDSPTLVGLAHNRKVAELAAEVLDSPDIRLGCDQLLIKPPFLEAKTLQEIAPFQGVVGGGILCLTPGEGVPAPFPHQEGSVTFVQGDLPIPFSLLRDTSSRYLLVIYCKRNAVYVCNAQDPACHRLKRMGYVYGDRLRDELNPILASSAQV